MLREDPCSACSSAWIADSCIIANLESGEVSNSRTRVLELHSKLSFPQYLTIMRGKFVCLSYPSGAFCVARSRTPTAAFESLGFRYMHPHFVPTFSSHRQLQGGLSCRPAITIVLSASCSAPWHRLANDGHLKVFPPIWRELVV